MQEAKTKKQLETKKREDFPLTKQLETKKREDFPLTKTNFKLMGIAGAIIVIGFLLMLGGSSTEEAFNPDIYSTRRIIVDLQSHFLGSCLWASE